MFILLFLAISAIILILLIAVWVSKIKQEERTVLKQRQEEIHRIHQQEEKARKDADQTQINFYRQQETELAAQYARSPLLNEILEYLCSGQPGEILPEEFIIRNNCIQSHTNGVVRTYDFTANRVPHFEIAHGSGTTDVEKYLLKPQMAMGRAINYVMHNEYDISDHANRTHEFIDSGTFFNTYESNYVQLRLKIKKNF